MSKFIAAFALALLLYPAIGWAQLVPSGTLTPGHALRLLTTGGVVGDAGGAAGSPTNGKNYLTEIGITNTGTPFCINDALTSGPYHQLCFGSLMTLNGHTGAFFTYNAYGGAAQHSSFFDLNGVDYEFPYTVGGIVGPVSTTVNDCVIWNNSSGTLVKDNPCAVSAPNNTALKAITAGSYATIERMGFANPGDGGDMVYAWSSSPCSLNAGAGDNGYEVAPNTGTGCWVAQVQGQRVDIRLWGLPGTSDDTSLFDKADAAIGDALWPATATKTVYVPPGTTNIGYTSSHCISNIGGIVGDSEYTTTLAEIAAGTTSTQVVRYCGTAPFTLEHLAVTGPVYDPATWATPAGLHLIRIGPTTAVNAFNFTARHLRLLGSQNGILVAQTQYVDIDDVFMDRNFGIGITVSDALDTATVRTQHIRINNVFGRGIGQACVSLPAFNSGVMAAPRDIYIRSARCDGSGFVASKGCYDITGSSADDMDVEATGYNCFNGGLASKRIASTTNNVPNEYRNQRFKITYYANIDSGWCFAPNFETATSVSNDERGQMYADVFCTFTKPAIYQPSWYYNIGDVVKETTSQNYYMAIAPTNGGVTGASSPPTTTSHAIVDGGVTWQYLQAAPSNDKAVSLTGVLLASITDAEIHLHMQNIGFGYDLTFEGAVDHAIRRTDLWLDGTVNNACFIDSVPSEFGLANAVADYLTIHPVCRSNGIGGSSAAFQIASVSSGDKVNYDHTQILGGSITALAGAAFYTAQASATTSIEIDGTHLTGANGTIIVQGNNNLKLGGGTVVDVSSSGSTNQPILGNTADAVGIVESDGYITSRSAVAVGGGVYPTTGNANSGATSFKIRSIRGYATASPTNTGCSYGDIFLAATPGAGGEPVNGWMCTTPSTTNGTWSTF